eukprot:6174188-Pleurochrysis_carterae.AAC.2
MQASFAWEFVSFRPFRCYALHQVQSGATASRLQHRFTHALEPESRHLNAWFGSQDHQSGSR